MGNFMSKSYNNTLYYQSSEWHVRFVIVTQISISRLDFYSRNKLKFIYSEKVTKFCEISNVDLTVTTRDKSMVEISQKFVAFLEYMNFTNIYSVTAALMCLLEVPNKINYIPKVVIIEIIILVLESHTFLIEFQYFRG
jgi:hypothetical protein